MARNLLILRSTAYGFLEAREIDGKRQLQPGPDHTCPAGNAYWFRPNEGGWQRTGCWRSGVRDEDGQSVGICARDPHACRCAFAPTGNQRAQQGVLQGGTWRGGGGRARRLARVLISWTLAGQPKWGQDGAGGSGMAARRRRTV